jgi:DUF4097 and DUF4098 domain-containing protein YvlB
MELVNTQEISLENTNSIAVLYGSEQITLCQGNADTLIIKEYMSRDNQDYYAHISNSSGKLTVEKGRRPIGIFFNTFRARVEVYLPAPGTGNIKVRTSSGRIEAEEALSASAIEVESSSGSISLNRITADTANFETASGRIRVQEVTAGEIAFSSSSGDIRCEKAQGNTAIHTKSGGIVFEYIEGTVSAESSSGRIDLKGVTEAVTVKTTSGAIHCTVTGTVGDISLTAASGSVTLAIPRNRGFRFSSRTSSGSLTTPFSDNLSSPLSDRHTAQGLVGASDASGTVNINTSSGSIRVNWLD